MAGTDRLAGYVDDTALGVEGYGSLVDLLLEQVPELSHPLSVRTFARMRHEPQLSAILRVYLLAIERGKWSVDGAGCRDEVTARLADDLGLPIKGADDEPTGARRRCFSWSKHLRVAAPLLLTFGHAPFAQQWDTGDGYRLAVVQERMPQTIARVLFNRDGTLKAAEQNALVGQHGPMLTTADHQLIWYVRERLGSNYFGESLLRPSYGPWLIKDQLLRVHATSIRRNGMGVWQIGAPPGATPQQIAEAARIAATTKASEHAGIGLPPGFTAELKGMSGSLPDTLGFINYIDRQMTRSTLTSLLDMATADRGNRSLGETIMQLMVYSQQTEADRIAEDGTEQIAIPLVDANWGEAEPAPRIVVEDVGADDQLTAQDLNWLLQYAAITPDDTLEADIRKRKGLPEIDLATRRLAAAPTPPEPAPAAPPVPPVPPAGGAA